MKKIVSILMAISFIICMMSVLSLTPSAKNCNGPSNTGNDYVQFLTLYSYDGPYINSILYNGKGYLKDATLESASYDKKTNTLTLNNLNYPMCSLYSRSIGYNASITITGTGSLALNSERYTSSAPLAIYGSATETSLTIAPTATLSIFTINNAVPSLTIKNSTLSSNALNGITAKATKEKKEDGKYVFGAYSDELNEYLYPCVANANTPYDIDGANYAARRNGWNAYKYGYTIFKLEHDAILNATVAIPVYDNNGNVVDSANFTVNENDYLYALYADYTDCLNEYTYSGDDSRFTGNGRVFALEKWGGSYYSYYNGSEYSAYTPNGYNIYEIIESPTLGPIFDYIGYFYDGIPEGFAPLNKTTTYTYTFTGDFSQKGTCLRKLADGKYYYFKNGEKTKATLLFKHTDGKYYYVKDGVVTKSTLLFKHTDGKYYYLKNGVVTKSTLLFKHTDGKYYYVKNGVVTKATLLFKHTDGKYYYVKNGVVTKSTLLFKHTDKKFYYVKNGVVTKSTLLFKHTDGKYYYVKNGVVTKATLIYKFNGAKRYIKNGVWQSSYTGKATVGGKTYNVKKGNVA